MICELLKPFTTVAKRLNYSVLRKSQTSHVISRDSLAKFKSSTATQHKAITPDEVHAKFNNGNIPWSDKLHILQPENQSVIPMFRVIDKSGRIINPAQDPKLDHAACVKMYECMVLTRVLDGVMYDAQRQGRVSFYMTSAGEEATHAGSAAALRVDDLVYAQYREAGVLLYRGVELEEMMDQCYGNYEDKGQGKQMPVHYGSRMHNFVTISSPLATQMPQAAGSAYALRRSGGGRCVIAYFGEGAASEGDAHAAFNFASTLDCPVVFFCRNNGFAISTPSDEQYRGDGIAGRAAGYGAACVRVDGNDALAVFVATCAAREYATTNNRPVIVEAMTYRLGHHSTSDDSSAYRSTQEVEGRRREDDPLDRLRLYLESRGFWDDRLQQQFVADAKKRVLEAFTKAEKKLKPEWQEMFNGVYFDMPDHISEQLKYMEEHVKKYKDKYPIQEFKSSS